MDVCGGVITNNKLEGYNDEIISNNIIKFTYTCGDFQMFCELIDNELHVISKGGYSNNRDGKYFVLDYKTNNLDFLKELNDFVKNNNISQNNGYCYEVSGLPYGCGDSINITFESGEQIYKSNNQTPNLTYEEKDELYNLFHKLAKENNLDFNSEGSNVKLYNDADIEYLQGSWKGKHFGNDIEAIFDNNHVKIFVNNELLDDTDFIIYEGCIKPNKLEEGIDSPKNEYSYIPFNACTSIRKKNEILLVMYFTKESYSTCELLRQKNS